MKHAKGSTLGRFMAAHIGEATPRYKRGTNTGSIRGAIGITILIIVALMVL